MADLKTAYGGQTPMNEDSDLEVDQLIENANRLLESVYQDINVGSASCSSRSGQSSRRPLTPMPVENWRDAQIERINRFCDTIDLDTLLTPEPEVRPITRRRLVSVRDRASQPNTIFNDVIDLVNQSTQDLESSSTAMISDVSNNVNDEDDDVVIVSSDLNPIVDLCMPVRRNTHRSRSPLHQQQCPVQTSTTHIQRPQQQRQLHLPNSSVTNSASSEDVAASSSSERVGLMCPVCMESSVRRRPTSTKCGHIFCESCINHAIRITHKCPMCNMKLSNKMIFRIYL